MAQATEQKTQNYKAEGINAKNVTSDEVDFLKKYGDKLSRTTRYAKWIHSPDEKEDHPGQTLATQNIDVIKAWAEERGGTPAKVPGTDHGDHLGVMRIQFPGYGGKSLEPTTWDEWEKTMRDRKLVFLFQQHMRNGNMSNFFHFDSPLREHD
ncbi:MAG TPA: hypothetical protein VFB58_01450 [Chloroflexota bacterium]|nr:hypothetical protein [Chloroflexota bacterium]